MIKEFFKEHDHFKFMMRRYKLEDDNFEVDGWLVEIYNTTCNEVCFKHFYPDSDIDNLNVDFEVAVMTPIISWWEESQERYKQWLEEYKLRRW